MLHAACALALLAGCGADREPGGKAGEAIPEAPGAAANADTAAAGYIGSAACTACHAAETMAWTGSDHDLAMQAATAATVLGDFDDATFSHNGIVTRFFRRNGDYYVETDGPDGAPTEYRVSHTFGVRPLQQYLVEYTRGRLQALSIAWDTRPAANGGRRWFHLYGEEPIPAGDPLHWTGPYQNWNGMCADCHSTAVEKGYDLEADRFATRFAEEDVGCEACHGPGAAHVAAPTSAGMRLGSVARSWVQSGDGPIATRTGERPPLDEPERCAHCHSRRAELRDSPPDTSLLDAYRPELLRAGLYHVDGQVREEVYVYGSFLQSAMAAAGVVCSDCHDPHSLQLRAAGNALCAKCHLPSAFDGRDHHRHGPGADAPTCVDCHMRAGTFMIVDARRDHSFRVPRPDLTVTLGTPNACNDCHSDRSAEWARDRVRSWYPAGRSLQAHFATAFATADRWQAGRSAGLREVASSADTPGIVRASAIERLGAQLDSPSVDMLRRLAADDDPLVQLAVVGASGALGFGPRIDIAQRFLSDVDLALRVAAADVLAPARASLTAGRQADLDAAVDAAFAAYTFSSDRPEGLLARANLSASLNRMTDVERDLRLATERFPWYTPATVNLADHYRATGRETAAYTLLSERAEIEVDDPALKLALGLAEVRRGDYAAAVESLRQAAALAPDEPYYAYVLGVALHSVGESSDAMAVLEAAAARFPGYRDTWYALATISRDLGEADRSAGYARRLLDVAPGDSAALALLAELGAR